MISMGKVGGLAISLALLLVVACDEEAPGRADASDAAVTDAGIDARAPDAASGPCWADGLELPCCYQRTNADRPAPQWKVVAGDIDAPAALTETLVEVGISHVFQSDAALILLELGTDAAGAPVVHVGTGRVAPDGDEAEYLWYRGDAPGPGDPTRWDRRTGAVTFDGGVWSSEAIRETLIIPTYDAHARLESEMHFRDVRAEMIDATLDGTCIGQLDTTESQWQFGTARVTAFLPVEPARVGVVFALGISLCHLLAGTACTEPQSAWAEKPDSICDDTGCRVGECTPEETCNAWLLSTRIAAAGTAVR